MSQLQIQDKYVLMIRNQNQFGSIAVLDNYADTLYLLKLLTPLGIQLTFDTYGNPPALPKALAPHAIRELETLFQKYFPKYFLGNFHQKAPESMLLQLSDGTRYIELQDFFNQENENTIHEVNWDNILPRAISLQYGDTEQNLSKRQNDFSDFDYKVPPLRPGDYIRFQDLYEAPVEQAMNSLLRRFLGRTDQLPIINLSDCPLRILQVISYGIGYTPKQPQAQQIYGVLSQIAWDRLTDSQKLRLQRELNWDDILFTELPHLLFNIGFAPKHHKFSLIETIDGRDYQNPRQYSFKPISTGLEAIIEMHDSSDISCLIAIAENPDSISKKQSSGSADETRPIAIYSILPYPEYVHYMFNEKLRDPSFNKKKHLKDYSVLLRFGFLPDGDIIILHQDKTVHTEFNASKQQMLFRIFRNFEIFNETGMGLDYDYRVIDHPLPGTNTNKI